MAVGRSCQLDGAVGEVAREVRPQTNTRERERDLNLPLKVTVGGVSRCCERWDSDCVSRRAWNFPTTQLFFLSFGVAFRSQRFIWFDVTQAVVAQRALPLTLYLVCFPPLPRLFPTSAFPCTTMRRSNPEWRGSQRASADRKPAKTPAQIVDMLGQLPQPSFTCSFFVESLYVSFLLLKVVLGLILDALTCNRVIAWEKVDAEWVSSQLGKKCVAVTLNEVCFPTQQAVLLRCVVLCVHFVGELHVCRFTAMSVLLATLSGTLFPTVNDEPQPGECRCWRHWHVPWLAHVHL